MTACVMCARGLCQEHFDFDSGHIPNKVKEAPRDLTWSKKGPLKDPLSTGRKRAAALYPIDPNADCEWANRYNVGGGEIPINGCGIRPNIPVGKQKHRHHGNYDTTDNSPENVHLICAACHVQWHAVNDPLKDQLFIKKYGHGSKKGRIKLNG